MFDVNQVLTIHLNDGKLITVRVATLAGSGVNYATEQRELQMKKFIATAVLVCFLGVVSSGFAQVFGGFCPPGTEHQAQFIGFDFLAPFPHEVWVDQCVYTPVGKWCDENEGWNYLGCVNRLNSMRPIEKPIPTPPTNPGINSWVTPPGQPNSRPQTPDGLNPRGNNAQPQQEEQRNYCGGTKTYQQYLDDFYSTSPNNGCL